MNSILLLMLACLPQQQDFGSASAGYASAAATPSETVSLYTERVEQTTQRVEQLEQRLASDKETLAALDELEVERYVALKTHFSGAQLEERLQDESCRFEMKRANLHESISLTKVDLDDAKRRLEQLSVDLKLARIEQGLAEKPKRAVEETTIDRLAEKSRGLLYDRAMVVGRFQWKSTPRSWVSREV